MTKKQFRNYLFAEYDIRFHTPDGEFSSFVPDMVDGILNYAEYIAGSHNKYESYDFLCEVFPSIENEILRDVDFLGDELSMQRLKACLKEFDFNGKYGERGEWFIVKGGYDCDFVVYVNNEPVVDCIVGKLEPVTENFPRIDEILDTIRSEYADVR